MTPLPASKPPYNRAAFFIDILTINILEIREEAVFKAQRSINLVYLAILVILVILVILEKMYFVLTTRYLIKFFISVYG